MQAWTGTRPRKTSTLKRLPLAAAIYLSFG